MTLRTTINVLWGCLVAVLVAILYLQKDEYELPSGWLEIFAALAIGSLILFLACMLARWLVLAPALAGYRRASAAGDWVRADRLCSRLELYFRDSSPTLLKLRMQRASALMTLQQYAEAKNVLDQMRQVALAPEELPWVLNSVAWCELEVGQPNKAIETARSALAAAEACRYPNIRYCKGTLGAAYVVAEQPEKGIPYLQEALGPGGGSPGRYFRGFTAAEMSRAVQYAGGHNKAQATRAFFLGQALEKIGQTEEAKEAYEFAVHVYPDGEYGKLAQEKLNDLK